MNQITYLFLAFLFVLNCIISEALIFLSVFLHLFCGLKWFTIGGSSLLIDIFDPAALSFSCRMVDSFSANISCPFGPAAASSFSSISCLRETELLVLFVFAICNIQLSMLSRFIYIYLSFLKTHDLGCHLL